MPIDFRDYQKEAIVQAVKAMRSGQRGFLFHHDPGLGKTLSAIAASRVLKAQQVLVLTPVVGLGVWKRELQRWYPQSAGAIVRSKGGEAWGSNPAAAYWHITNYEQASGPLELYLRRLKNIDLLIADESQFLKTHNAKRTRRVMKLVENSKHVLLLSGTPAHSPLDWWSQFRMIDPETLPWAWPFAKYKQWIARLGGPNANWVEGFREEEKQVAIAAMARSCHVATSDQMNLPAPIETPIEFALTGPELRVYSEMLEHLRSELDNGEETSAEIILTKLLRLHQITGGHSTTDSGEKAAIGTTKLHMCKELLDIRPEQKVVIAARFTWEIEQLSSLIKGRPVRVISGKTSMSDRAAIQDWFQDEKHNGVLLLQYRAGGMALTLTAASAMILYSFEPSVIALLQMLGRIYRLGTTTHVQILPLLAKGTIDEDLWYGLKAKKEGVDLAKFIRERQKV